MDVMFNRTFTQGFKDFLLFFPSLFQVSTCAYVTQKVEFAGIRYSANISLTPHVLYMYQHVMFTVQCVQMFNLVYISSGI